jgi:hypothetical protein
MTTDVTGFIACDGAADRVALLGGLVHEHRPLTGRALRVAAVPPWRRRFTIYFDGRIPTR